MIFTLYYMYATFLQWWRLGSLKNKLNGTLNSQNSLLVCTTDVIYDHRKQRSIENLLFRKGDRIGCTVVPKQKINLAQWVLFPKDLGYFPIYFTSCRQRIESPNIYILLQAVLETYKKHHSNIIQLENYGELVAWKISDTFETILKTDMDKLTKLIHYFSLSNLDMNHELQLLKVETVEVEGIATKIKYEKRFTPDLTLKYSYSSVHWKKFVSEVKQIHAKARDVTTPKITIENGAAANKTEEAKKVPVSEVKPIKKSEDKNTLEVGASDFRRHKSADHGRNKDKHKVESKPVEDRKLKESKPVKKDSKEKDKKSQKAKEKTKSTPSTSASHSESKSKSKPSKDKQKYKLGSIDKQKCVEVPAESGDVIKREFSTQANGDVLTKDVKPPNVLVYADSLVAKDNVKLVLQSMINREKYTIYDLPANMSTAIWNSSTALVIVCGAVSPSLTSHLLHYLLNGGQLLCLCSDFLYSVLHTFTTAEVREHELVRFSYGQWQQVQMMHHIFCYQASPAKKQFSKDSDHSNPSSGNGSSPIAPRTPSAVEIQHNGQEYIILVQVLGAEETWQTPSLMLATVKDNKGRAIFSQVHLEISPSQYEDDENKFAALKNSDQARLEILKDILSNHFNIDCTSTEDITYTNAYFLGRHDLKLKMLSECGNIVNNELTCDKITVKFCGKDTEPDAATSNFLPVLIHSCPVNFSTVNYYEALETEYIGRLVIFSDVVGSSQWIINKTLTHGIVVIPRQQTNGIGRSNNFWISPVGSAMFSLQLHIPLESTLGKALPLVQQLVMVAVVNVIRNIEGCKELNIGIKWPNDLYADGNVKIGGLIVNSSVDSSNAVVNIGCGINLYNSNPTTCLNDLIEEANLANKTDIKLIGFETYFALVFNEIEKLFNKVQSDGLGEFYELYYKFWLHSDSNVRISNKDGTSKTVKIVGIDTYGFLRVCTEDGVETTVQPDGNTFDMMKGLIAPKSF